MDIRNRLKFNSIFRVIIPTLILVLLFTSFSFATDGAEGNAAPSVGEEQVKTVGDFSHEITAEDIARYGYYHGKNATRIPVITYHEIVSDKEKKSKQYKKDQWTISQSAFNKQMRYLKNKRYRTINCDEFYLWYIGAIKLPKRSVLITFDDGLRSSIERSVPLLNKYNMKATYFLIGAPVHAGGSDRFISEESVRQIRAAYPNIEFQSHTYGLHYREAMFAGYETFERDAATQKQTFGFDYIAYPYGRKSDAMIAAYRASGLRMAFSFSDYGYATRKQNAFKIKRFGVKGKTSLGQFKRWCR